MTSLTRIGLVVVVFAAAAVVVASKSSRESASASAPVAQATAGLPKIVCLGAGKCVPCKAMEPVREALRSEYAGRLGVEFYDVWKDRSLGERYNVHIIPTTIFYDAEGRELERVEGFISKEDILGKFETLGIHLKG
jgi:thioredoxin 1